MGMCCNPRSGLGPGLSAEEAAIISGEGELELDGVVAEEVVSLTDIIASEEFLPYALLPNWLESVGCDSSGALALGSPLLMFYRSLVDTERDSIPKVLLKTLGICLGKAEFREKTQLIFATFTGDSVIERAGILQMLSAISRVSIELVWLGSNRDLGDSKLTEYHTKLNAGRTRFLSTYVSRLYSGKRLTLKAFSESVLKNRGILSPRLVRLEILKFFRETEFIPLRDSEIKGVAEPTGPPILLCHKGHQLLWTNSTPFEYFNKRKNWTIFCEKCSRSFTRAGWHCAQCGYDVCDNCGEALGVMPQAHKCPAGHVLIFECEVPGSCRVCSSNKEFAWHCRKCEYSVCVLCGEKSGYSVPVDSLKCRAGHELTGGETDSVVQECCGYCGELIIERGVRCDACEFGYCLKCSEFLACYMGPHPGFQCCNGHMLHWYSRSGSNCRYRCNTCNEVRVGKCYSCVLCRIHMCGDCGVKLSALFSFPIEVDCENGHPLNWFSNPLFNGDSSVYECSKCGQVYVSSGSLHCQVCSSDVCLNCLEVQELAPP